ncbi:hypothetical protein K4K49_006383 [Colletotrichum sp. SAR 10_70]|nr:hypothetical protein K4K50_000053 [Colletotrichum sp. SAR 10_71]KAI8203908.1 hypothetical protein K4K49_006383 [Colletotrichum sp. SAR 10_70]KAI8213186.1 hypothetical protein K4K52_005759 [Colletotrichum sp. SAR 10_76]
MVKTQGPTSRIVANGAPSNGYLQCLPSELIARIIENLDLKSMKTFRLANRFTAAQCLIPPFLRFYSYQSASLTPTSLEHLIERTSSKIVSRAVKHVTVHATKFAASDSGNDDERLVAELATALANVGTLGCLEISPQKKRFHQVKLPKLRKLTLDMVPVNEASFLTFLANSPFIEDLSLRFVHIRQGSWESFLGKITNPLAKLQLDCISDDTRNSINLWPDGLPGMQEEDSDVSHGDEEHVDASSLDSAKNLYKRDFNTEDIRQGLVLR